MLLKKYFLKITNTLSKPHNLTIKVFEKINYFLNYRKYNLDLFEKEQNIIFNQYGLNREEGICNLNNIKKSNINFNNDKGLSSEHEVIFSSLSINKNIHLNNILEIGTFDGYNAMLLGNLFPNSNIDTIDLPENDEDFINSYNRQDNVDSFIKDRNNLLSKNKNVNFFPMNSLKLLNQKKKYDLIWIDGAHGYPVVCIDIINSLHILNENGLMLCDDVLLNVNPTISSSMYASTATIETLDQLKKQNLINFQLAFKRLNPENNCLKNKRKFIAIVKKI